MVVEPNATRNSIIFALVVGVTICMYSIVDKVGVSVIDIDPITYILCLLLVDRKEDTLISR